MGSDASARPREYVPPPHQARVDAIQAQLRAEAARGRPSIFRPPPPPPAPSTSEIDHRIAEELQLAARQVEQIGAALVADPAFLHRHGLSLQGLDLIEQNLRHLAAVISVEDKKAAAERISLEELRRRMTRKSIRAIAS